MKDLPEGGKEVFFDPVHVGFQTVEAILDGFCPPVAIADKPIIPGVLMFPLTVQIVFNHKVFMWNRTIVNTNNLDDSLLYFALHQGYANAVPIDAAPRKWKKVRPDGLIDPIYFTLNKTKSKDLKPLSDHWGNVVNAVFDTLVKRDRFGKKLARKLVNYLFRDDYRRNDITSTLINQLVRYPLMRNWREGPRWHF
ncbi:hypothetical protein [Moorena sp. SIO3A5]|uniref:hypothetical protein n=1 Tax=Moorena sp. SIO3A5 TaxID=2607822 RepID=UPI00141D2CE8|nr:hypothetical protein [Moorena sp. SIO3A5]NEP69022.1 hypothetical protein [Moorena sp. SIO3A5]